MHPHLVFSFIYLFGPYTRSSLLHDVSSSCGELGLLASCHAQASHLAKHGLYSIQSPVVAACGFSSCGSQASLCCGTWDLPRPGIKHVSPALIGAFFNTEPPGKP